MIAGSITEVMVTFDGATWHKLPVKITLPQRLMVRVYFNIETPNTVRVKSILTFTYADQVTPFESPEGGVTTGTYFFDFTLDFSSGLPIGIYLFKAEVLYWDTEWKTLDMREGKFADVTYKLLGTLTALGRKVDEQLSPIPFSVPLGEPFTLGINGYLQTPQSGQMKLLIDVFTPTGEVISHRLTMDIGEAKATGWHATVDFEGLRVAGIYTARVRLYFDETYLAGFEGRVFDVTAAPSPIVAAMGTLGAIMAVGLIGAIAAKMLK